MGHHPNHIQTIVVVNWADQSLMSCAGAAVRAQGLLSTALLGGPAVEDSS